MVGGGNNNTGSIGIEAIVSYYFNLSYLTYFYILLLSFGYYFTLSFSKEDVSYYFIDDYNLADWVSVSGVEKLFYFLWICEFPLT